MSLEQVLIRHDGRERSIAAQHGVDLLSLLREEGYGPLAPCGGNHTCGKCVIQATGALSLCSDQEQFLLAGRAGRLACMTEVLGPCTVTLADSATGQVLVGQAPIPARTPLFSSGYGVAVDIGTTTVAAYLYGLQGGAPLASTGAYNVQGRYGADVMTRITHDRGDKDHILQGLILRQLSALILTLCQNAKVAPASVSAAVLTGNTTMLHFLTGLESASLAAAPFTPKSLFGTWHNLTLPGLEQVQCYLPPCVSAYVGADITCGILSSGLLDRHGTVLLVDVGTNGEMVLKTGNRLVCCSAAAGPAFEGAGISQGSGAVPGAINQVQARAGVLTYTTIENAPAASICGSGLIDSVAAALELGLIEPSGRLAAGDILFPGSSVTLTQGDIRQVQLAKGAIRGGIDVMLETCGVQQEEIDTILLCGGFGSYLNPCSAEAVGLLPPGSAKKVEVLGNAAGAGASLLLLQQARLQQAADAAQCIQCVELSASPLFMDAFLSCMSFGGTDDSSIQLDRF